MGAIIVVGLMIPGMILLLNNPILMRDQEILIDFEYEEEMEEPAIKIEVIGKSVTFNHLLKVYMNADATNFQVSMELRNKVLYVTETFDDDEAAKGIKTIQIKGHVKNLAEGDYQILITYVNKYMNTSQAFDPVSFAI